MEAEKKRLKELDDKIYKLRRRLRKMEYKKMGINREIDKLEDSIQ
uniref:Uncharacterized protein n=1 Tax=Isavirus salaris TaxID=55987 RepID=Q9YR19_9ORTO|nr:unknown [Infectious salmon anemia virus]